EHYGSAVTYSNSLDRKTLHPCMRGHNACLPGDSALCRVHTQGGKRHVAPKIARRRHGDWSDRTHRRELRGKPPSTGSDHGRAAVSLLCISVSTPEDDRWG